MGSTNKFDDLLATLGTGRWNILVFMSVGYWHMHLVSNVLSGVFVAPAVNHTCIPPDHGYTLTSYTFTPSGKNITTANHCSYYTNETKDGTFQDKECTDWEYDNSTYSLTLTSQFDLVCSSEYLRATYQSLYMFGTLFGAPINGLVSDRYGRKLTLTLAVLTYFSLAMATSWLTTFASILAFRFILGFLHPAILQSGYILALEVIEPRYRAALGILLSLTWAMGTMAWGGVAYLIRDWRWLQLAVNLPSLFIFPVLWFLDESPRWLIVHGKFERASKTLVKAARWHKVTLPPSEDLQVLMHSIREESTTTKKAVREEGVRTYKQKAWRYLLHLLILFRTPNLRLFTFILCLNFLLVAFIFYGMSLNAVNYSADPFLYTILSGVVEMPAYIVTAVIVSYLGRKWPSIVLFFISGIVIMAAAFIPSGMNTVVIVLALMGRMCICCGYQVIYLYCVELFPTEVRLQGIGYCTIMSRIGSILSPFITDLLGPLYPSAPSLVFGLCAIVASLTTLLLPETLGRKLPDTITDLETKPTDIIRMEKRGEDDEECRTEGEGEGAAEIEEEELAKLRA
ncbi:hypothetical protein Pcinc_013377 [Petrolisthes cinctipes]|uniref:Major facilitator superfamily (MFS) profile domain-containing protein n=1 Tax=Petrolisthes cinctipes TaxID=88211 RepID=A0AAE1FX28_PETCI|nr:hypothetical protein Pcinc_013377 [Petrolisthes cinctipes]